jgi:alpha-amylase/alpha-mannosidase (GH57 family)
MVTGGSVLERYLCIHGHFYQPPRENPWLEAVEIQDSAHPYHDWNERITAECYAPNSAARLLDGDGRITDIISNYEQISFNFGPTLLLWMEHAAPAIYRSILDADHASRERRGGHGNALAQVYNHIIMPLANDRDKRTQVLWGIRDFEHRFRRYPEGMWLSETAVDPATLEVLADQGIRFTILAPRQAKRVRKIGAVEWQEVSDSRIDPTRAYLCPLPSGRVITLFFYDGPISQAVAFERLLARGEDFAHRLLHGFDDGRDWAQLMHIATDGETYGHHQKFGDMALGFALHHIETNGLAKVVNYAQYLELQPPEYEVEIFGNSSWSCIHGIERWRSNCGCSSGGYGHWNQEWRGPLRAALDWLRDAMAERFAAQAAGYLKEPWRARDDYISVILDRSPDSVDRFLERHAVRALNADERVTVLKLMEVQRLAMLMYTSCGWFFDEISGLETVQVLKYAGGAIRLCESIMPCDLEKLFLERLAKAKSNVPDHRDGAHIYEKFVKPSIIDVKKVGVHYAVSSLFEDYPEDTRIYCYRAVREDAILEQTGRTKLAVGRVSVTSGITQENDHLSYCVLYFGDHAFNGGVRTYRGDKAFGALRDEVVRSFRSGDLAGVVRMMDRHFGTNNYTLRDLFSDDKRKVLDQVTRSAVEEHEANYVRAYGDIRGLMTFLAESGAPLPKPFSAAAELALNVELRRAFSEPEVSIEKVRILAEDIRRWNVPLSAVDLEFLVRHRVEAMMGRLASAPDDIGQIEEVRKIIDLLNSLPVDVKFWQAQNDYYRAARMAYLDFLLRSRSGDDQAGAWIDAFRKLGRSLWFNIDAILPREEVGS